MSTWEEQLEAAQRRMRAVGGPTTPHRQPRPHRGVAQHTDRDRQRTLTGDSRPPPEVYPGRRSKPTDRDRRRTLLRLAGPPPEEAA